MRKKRLLSWILTLAMLLSMMPLSVFAADITENYKAKIVVSKIDDANGHEMVEVALQAKTASGNKLESMQPFGLAFDAEMFDLVDTEGDVITLTEDLDDAQGEEILAFPIAKNWTGETSSACVDSSKKIGYIFAQPKVTAKGALDTQGEFQSIATFQLQVKTGSSLANDFKATSVRLQTKAEASTLNQSSIVALNNNEDDPFTFGNLNGEDTLSEPEFAYEGLSVNKNGYTGTQADQPEVSVKKGTSVTLKANTEISGETVEYAAGTDSTQPSTGWQDSTEFTVSAPGTWYFFARVKETGEHTAGEIKTSDAVTVFGTPAFSYPNNNVVEASGQTTSVNIAPVVAAEGAGTLKYALADGASLPSGLTLDASTGAITGSLSLSDANGSVTVVATDAEDQTAEATITFKKANAIVTGMEISGAQNISVPTADVGETTRAIEDYTATVKDQFGDAMPDENVSWSISDATGVSVDADTGKVTVTNAAESGTVTLTATSVRNVQVSATKEITIQKDASTVTAVKLYSDAAGNSPLGDAVNIGILQNRDNTVTYYAKAYDQYGMEMSGETFDWNLTGDNGISNNDGTVTVASATEDNATATLTVTSSTDSSVSASVTITAIAIAVDWDVIEANTEMTYGDAKESAFAVLPEEGTATVADGTVNGRFTIENDDESLPVGSATITIAFTVTDAGAYEDVKLTKNYDITVTEREIVVSGIAAQDKEYDGTTDVLLDLTNVMLDNKVNGDDVTITVKGAFEDANAGENKTVLLSDLALTGTQAGNYVLASDGQQTETTATIRKASLLVETPPTASDIDYGAALNTSVLSGGVVKFGEEEVAGEWMFMFDEIPDAGTNSYIATFVPTTGSDNYAVVTLPVEVTVHKVAYSGEPITQNIALPVNKNVSGTISANTFTLPEGFKNVSVVSVDKTADEHNILTLSGADYTIQNATEVGWTATCNVVLSSTNYEDCTAVVTFTIIDKISVTISGINVVSRTYNAQPIAPTGTLSMVETNTGAPVTGIVPIYTYTGVEDTAYAASATAPTDAGKYKLVIAIAEDNQNYMGSSDDIFFEITKAPLVVKPQDVTITAGTAMPTFTVAYNGLQGNDVSIEMAVLSSGDLTMQAQTQNGSVLTTTNIAGDYIIRFVGQPVFNQNHNYTITTADGVLTVSQRSNNNTSGSSSGGSGGPSGLGASSSNNNTSKDNNTTDKDTKPDTNTPAQDTTTSTIVNGMNDVPSTEWYADAVKYVMDKNIMTGVGANRFAPSDPATRAMIATILYRIAGQPSVSANTSFTDVEAGTWYTNAVAWGQANGVITGQNAQTFNPNGNITREQLATILYRYSKAETPTTDMTATYSDASEVSSYATNAMKWAVAEGIINGSHNKLNPQGNATRAEIATMLSRYLQK